MYWDLVPPAPPCFVRCILKGDIVLDRPTRQLDLLVGAGAKPRGPCPEGYEDRNECNEAEEYGRLESASDSACEVGRDADEQGAEEEVRKAFVSSTFGGQGWIVDSCSLGYKLAGVN